jgi:uncharacterized membrane protein YdjX (TVP38/TMEM64 family)
MIKRNLKKHFFSIISIIFFVVIIYILSNSIPKETIQKFIEDAGLLGPLIYVFLTLLTYIFAPLSGTPLIYVGFYLFGQHLVFFHVIATIISSVINFWIARTWGRGLTIKLVGESSIVKVDKFTEKYGLQSLFILRVFQGGIHDFISYAAGLTSIKFWPYFIISTLGMIPGNLIWYFFASRTENPLIFTSFTLILATSFSLLYIFIVYLYKRLR